MKKNIFRVSLILSLLLNIFLVGRAVFIQSFMPTDAIGELQQDIEVSSFETDTTLFKIPKGTIVKNASPRGIAAMGQFENYRFTIIVTSDNPNLVNYNLPKTTGADGFYSVRSFPSNN